MSQLTDIIKTEIALRGKIPFARFMELALYCPEYGYYEKESDTVGQGGDFYTSVSVGSLFGELLAFQFAEWLTEIPAPKLQIVEAGAHDGKLAVDILGWIRGQRKELFARVEYVILEPSPRRRGWQERRLAEFRDKIVWWETATPPAEAQFSGVIFANELLDAMPVRRAGWDATKQKWFEWGVAWEANRFVWAKLEADAGVAELAGLPEELRTILPDGFTTEISPQAENWWRAAGQALRSGHLLTLDYGLRAEDFFTPQRMQGTLRAYRSHRSNDDVLAVPGEQDITAQVNFTRIQQAGECAGLKTNQFVKQSEFIVKIAQRFWPEAHTAGRWGAKQNRELHTLTHPEYLGRAFRVLVQSR